MTTICPVNRVTLRTPLLICKVQNMKTLAEALGGDPTFMDDIDTRNVPDTE